jgi:hypothetical protein
MTRRTLVDHILCCAVLLAIVLTHLGGSAAYTKWILQHSTDNSTWAGDVEAIISWFEFPGDLFPGYGHVWELDFDHQFEGNLRYFVGNAVLWGFVPAAILRLYLFSRQLRREVRPQQVRAFEIIRDATDEPEPQYPRGDQKI